jgi:hypothetical protein
MEPHGATFSYIIAARSVCEISSCLVRALVILHGKEKVYGSIP